MIGRRKEIPLCGELAVDQAMDLSCGRRQNESRSTWQSLQQRKKNACLASYSERLNA